MIHKTTALAALIAAAACAQHASALERRPAVIRHAPLRLELEDPRGLLQRTPLLGQPAPEDPWDGVVPREAIPESLRALLARAELAERRVQVLLGADGKPRAVVGNAKADVTVVAELGLGAAGVGVVRADGDVRIVGQREVAGPAGRASLYYRVVLKEGRGWAPAAQVALGEPTTISDHVGDALAPVFAAGTRLREARFFHPDGDVFRAKVESLAPETFRSAADGMAGEAIIRMGQGAWRVDPVTGAEPNRPDALSLAIRFYDPNAGAPTGAPRAGDFDLLVVSWAKRFRDFFLTVPMKSDPHDFFANEYYPAMPFELDGQPVSVRVVPAAVEPQGPSRIGKLLNAIDSGQAVFFLEVQGPPTRRLTRRGTRSSPAPWTRLARITLLEHLADFDQDALRFHPTMSGRGFSPSGWVTRVRRPVYRASQDAREGLTDTLEEGQ